MIQRGYRAGLALKAFAELFLGDFYRNIAIEAWVAGAVNLAHSARPQQSYDLIRPEFVTGRKRHGG